jgi:hypothetical protein
MIDFARLVFPTRSPAPGHRDESLVGVVVMHHWTMTRLGLAVAEIEPLADLDRSELRRLLADRRGDAIAGARWRGIDVPNKHIGTDLWLHQHYRICRRCATVDVQRNDDRAERDVSIARDCDIDAWASAKGRVGPRPRRGERP